MLTAACLVCLRLDAACFQAASAVLEHVGLWLLVPLKTDLLLCAGAPGTRVLRQGLPALCSGRWCFHPG